MLFNEMRTTTILICITFVKMSYGSLSRRISKMPENLARRRYGNDEGMGPSSVLAMAVGGLQPMGPSFYAAKGNNGLDITEEELEEPGTLQERPSKPISTRPKVDKNPPIPKSTRSRTTSHSKITEYYNTSDGRKVPDNLRYDKLLKKASDGIAKIEIDRKDGTTRSIPHLDLEIISRKRKYNLMELKYIVEAGIPEDWAEYITKSRTLHLISDNKCGSDVFLKTLELFASIFGSSASQKLSKVRAFEIDILGLKDAELNIERDKLSILEYRAESNEEKRSVIIFPSGAGRYVLAYRCTEFRFISVKNKYVPGKKYTIARFAVVVLGFFKIEKSKNGQPAIPDLQRVVPHLKSNDDYLRKLLTHEFDENDEPVSNDEYNFLTSEEKAPSKGKVNVKSSQKRSRSAGRELRGYENWSGENERFKENQRFKKANIHEKEDSSSDVAEEFKEVQSTFTGFANENENAIVTEMKTLRIHDDRGAKGRNK